MSTVTRLLLIAALAVSAIAASTGVAAAAVSDEEKRCEYGEEELSLLPEATFVALRETVALREAVEQVVAERCVLGFGGQDDCRVHDANRNPGHGASWTPWSPEPWLAAPQPWLAPPRYRAVAEPSVAVVLCDGYARGVERPPRG